MESAEVYIKNKQLFQLGILPTEQSHPMTTSLSDLAQNDLSLAFETLFKVDTEALKVISHLNSEIEKLSSEIEQTLKSGNKIFLCGCGATGRLSLSLEWLFNSQEKYPGQVVSLMAGGDVALVHSIEGFEDYPEYGAMHLKQLGFSKSDLLISSTEGGETPYVIGATNYASQVSERKPYFLYCNPDDILIEFVERSRKVLQDNNINKINLSVGPMALAGSTRMQASTVLQAAVGFAIEKSLGRTDSFSESLKCLSDRLSEVDRVKLANLTKEESAIYQAGEHILYMVDGAMITVFTDTTERAPTFSLSPFSNYKTATNSSLSYCYVIIKNAIDKQDAWAKLLGRSPRPLDWGDINAKTEMNYLFDFDFSSQAESWRKGLTKSKHHEFSVNDLGVEIELRLNSVSYKLNTKSMTVFERQLFLKMVLNAHSTLVMGRLNRYKSNLMTWVSPSNGKLIDRASRYLRILARQNDHELNENEAIELIFSTMKQLKPGESVVLKALNSIKF